MKRKSKSNPPEKKPKIVTKRPEGTSFMRLNVPLEVQARVKQLQADEKFLNEEGGRKITLSSYYESEMEIVYKRLINRADMAAKKRKKKELFDL